ncbi:MAG TPA: hypothetical protein HA257_02390 [Candidatus Methanoperedenaceae archaeon]|nr:hypothetical protein [Candidatus Methanoperedenaceae archaeon]
MTCDNCHGAGTSIAIPQCTKCHSGPIHQVHEKKVQAVACSYCHKTIDAKHNSILNETVCAHCHKDLISVHSPGGVEGCVKCHRSPPSIVKPAKVAGSTIICQTCHQAPNVKEVHGPGNTPCYNCHTPWAKDSKPSQIPHFIHVPKIECVDCHMDSGKVVIPQCAKCHDVNAIHSFSAIATKPQSSLSCSRCHPGTFGEGGAAVTPSGTSGTSPPARTAAAPGYESIMAIAALIALVYMKRNSQG